MALFNDEEPKKPAKHEIGADLSSLSVEELRGRIELLRGEIARIEAEVAAKGDSRQAAEKFFR